MLTSERNKNMMVKSMCFFINECGKVGKAKFTNVNHFWNIYIGSALERKFTHRQFECINRLMILSKHEYTLHEVTISVVFDTDFTLVFCLVPLV